MFPFLVPGTAAVTLKGFDKIVVKMIPSWRPWPTHVYGAGLSSLPVYATHAVSEC